jgi:hypothetical protein
MEATRNRSEEPAGGGAYRCNYCDASFANEEAMRSHQNLAHHGQESRHERYPSESPDSATEVGDGPDADDPGIGARKGSADVAGESRPKLSGASFDGERPSDRPEPSEPHTDKTVREAPVAAGRGAAFRVDLESLQFVRSNRRSWRDSRPGPQWGAD